MLEFKYDTQLLIEGKNLDEDTVNEYFKSNFKGDCLLAVGDESLIYCPLLQTTQLFAMPPTAGYASRRLARAV